MYQRHFNYEFKVNKIYKKKKRQIYLYFKKDNKFEVDENSMNIITQNLGIEQK